MSNKKIVILISMIIIGSYILFSVLFSYLSGNYSSPYTENEIITLISKDINSNCTLIKKEKTFTHKNATKRERKATTYTLKSDNNMYYIVETGISVGSLFPELPHKYYRTFTYTNDEYNVKNISDEIEKDIDNIAKQYGYQIEIIDNEATYSFSIIGRISKENEDIFYSAVYEYLNNREDVSYIEDKIDFNYRKYIIHFKEYTTTFEKNLNYYID